MYEIQCQYMVLTSTLQGHYHVVPKRELIEINACSVGMKFYVRVCLFRLFSLFFSGLIIIINPNLSRYSIVYINEKPRKKIPRVQKLMFVCCFSYLVETRALFGVFLVNIY